MLILFELSMPGVNSWNGKWIGENDVHVIIKNVGTSLKARTKYEKMIGNYSYNFGDGWCACVTVRSVTSAAARELRKANKGFCGYDWMVDSIIRNGKIEPEIIGRA